MTGHVRFVPRNVLYSDNVTQIVCTLVHIYNNNNNDKLVFSQKSIHPEIHGNFINAPTKKEKKILSQSFCDSRVWYLIVIVNVLNIYDKFNL